MRRIILALIAFFASLTLARAEPRWMTLPPTPDLPKAQRSGYETINGARIWYAVFGAGEPVIMLHGGLANSNYWGIQAQALARRYQVIVIDSRGHGRSSTNGEPFGYSFMADDVFGLMEALRIPRAALVGWSDGAIIGLDMAIRHPERLTKLFAFAANYNPDGVADIASSPVFKAYIERAGKEYERLSPTPRGYADFRSSIEKMWDSQPNFTKEQMRGIKTLTWIVDGDHDEAIKRPHAEEMAALIPNAGLLILPQTSHFAFLQDSTGFTSEVLRFLAMK